MVAQFKAKTLDNKSKGNQINFISGIKANISKVPPPIPSRPSKKILEKLMFYKGNKISGTLFLGNNLYAQAFKNNI